MFFIFWIKHTRLIIQKRKKKILSEIMGDHSILVKYMNKLKFYMLISKKIKFSLLCIGGGGDKWSKNGNMGMMRMRFFERLFCLRSFYHRWVGLFLFISMCLYMCVWVMSAWICIYEYMSICLYRFDYCIYGFPQYLCIYVSLYRWWKKCVIMINTECSLRHDFKRRMFPIMTGWSIWAKEEKAIGINNRKAELRAGDLAR